MARYETELDDYTFMSDPDNADKVLDASPEKSNNSSRCAMLTLSNRLARIGTQTNHRFEEQAGHSAIAIT